MISLCFLSLIAKVVLFQKKSKRYDFYLGILRAENGNVLVGQSLAFEFIVGVIGYLFYMTLHCFHDMRVRRKRITISQKDKNIAYFREPMHNHTSFLAMH